MVTENKVLILLGYFAPDSIKNVVSVTSRILDSLLLENCTVGPKNGNFFENQPNPHLLHYILVLNPDFAPDSIKNVVSVTSRNFGFLTPRKLHCGTLKW